MNNNIYYKKDNISLLCGDSLELLSTLKSKSFDMIFADPPYFLSTDGITCKNGKMVNVNKGDWDKSLSYKEKYEFNKRWIKKCKRLLKDNGTIWISGTFHNIYIIGSILEEIGFSIINNITWQKPNPPPNLACRCFTNSTETIIWARKQISPGKKGKHTFNYDLMKKINGDKQMKDVWTLLPPLTVEKIFGKHPTQKPLKLLEYIVLSSTNEGDIVLDPFVGSGTTAIICKRFKRSFMGIDFSSDYLDLAIKRIENDVD